MIYRLPFVAILALALALAALGIISSGDAANAGGDGGQGPRAVSILGVAQVQGQDVIVDVLVAVEPGESASEAALAALERQGARPLGSAGLGSQGFTVTGLVWDSLPVVQNYNPSSEPAAVDGLAALTGTHATWDGVATSFFDIDFGTLTDRCPSLVRECPGPQFFDGNNDVAWLRLDPRTLGVTWYGTSTDEADMALNTRFNWNDGCVGVSGSYDAQTVLLHENGHVVGLGHSDIKAAVMYPSYQGARCALHQDDSEGATYLYDTSITGSVSGTVTDGTNPIAGAKVVLEDTSLQATTAADGSYTISGVPDPVTYTVTASADGFDSATISRLTVDGATAADFTLTPSGGEENGGGGACPPGKPDHPKCS